MTDRETVQEIKNGNTELFKEVVKRHGSLIYSVCIRYCGSEIDAMDLTQDVFMMALKSIHRFKGESALSTWLYSIAVHHCINVSRRKRRVLFFSLDKNVMVGDEGISVEPVDPKGDTEDYLVRREREARVQNAIEALIPEYRIVVILKYIEDKSYEEIAQICNIPVGTVGSRLSRAIEELKKILKDDGGGV